MSYSKSIMRVCVAGTIHNILAMGLFAMGYGELCFSHLNFAIGWLFTFYFFHVGVYQDDVGSGENKFFRLFIASHQFCIVFVALPSTWFDSHAVEKNWYLHFMHISAYLLEIL